MSNQSEFERFKRVMENLPEGFRGKIEAIMEENAQEAATYAKQLAPVDDGYLQNSIGVVADPNRNTDTVISRSVVAEAQYAPYVEFGTKSRAKPPPEWNAYALEFRGKKGWRTGAYESIMRWASKKGFTMEQARTLFFSIMKYGIHPHPFMYPAFSKQKQKLINDLRKALAKL